MYKQLTMKCSIHYVYCLLIALVLPIVISAASFNPFQEHFPNDVRTLQIQEQDTGKVLWIYMSYSTYTCILSTVSELGLRDSLDKIRDKIGLKIMIGNPLPTIQSRQSNWQSNSDPKGVTWWSAYFYKSFFMIF